MEEVKGVTVLDVRGAKCHMPVVRAKQAIDRARPGDVLEVHATDPGSVSDFRGWAQISKVATLDDQRTEIDATGQVVYVHVLRRRV